MKIYDDAHKLAKQIRESKEYKEYKELNFGKENEFKRQGRIRGVCNRVLNEI